MKVLGILFLILCLSAVLQAQQTGTVVGRVTDGAAAGISRSRVTMTSLDSPNLTFTVEADADGNFVFANVPPGNYRITAGGGVLAIRMSGEKRIAVIAGSNPPIEIVVSAPTINETVTIAASDSQQEDQISKTVSVIDAQEMRDRADFTLVDSLRTIPGFRVQQLGGFGRTASIKARGLRNQDTAVLIDGIRFRDPGAINGDATPFLSDFTLTGVDKIEVLRGSGSSLYGTNAIGGTIDFQTPRPKPGVHGQVSGNAGGLGFGRFRGNIGYGTRDNRFGFLTSVSRTAYTKGIDGDDNASNTNFQTRLEFNPTTRTNLSGRFFVSDARVRLNFGPDTLGPLPPATTIIEAREGINFTPDLDDPDSIQHSRFFAAQFAASHTVNSRLILNGWYQGLVTKRENGDGPLGPGNFQTAFTSNFGGDIHTANIRAIVTPDSHNTITGGYEFEVENFRNSGSSSTDTFSTEASQRSHTLFVQDLVSLLDGRFQLAGGARAQWFSLGSPTFSTTPSPYEDFVLSDPPAAYTFDGSASYFISRSGTKIRTHVGSGYRVPSLYERFGTFFFAGLFFAQGNPDLKPERSVGIDAGVDQYFAGQKVKASATWFYTRIKDEITYLPTDDFSAPVYYNFDRHVSRGAEFSIDARPTRSTDIFASYTFTNSDVTNFRRTMIVLATSTVRRAFAIPDHQFTMVVTQRIKRFWASLDLLATSSYLAPVFSNSTFQQYTYRFDGNRRADLTAGYTFPMRNEKYSLRLFGTIENLFDHRYFENGFQTPGRNGRAGLAFAF